MAAGGPTDLRRRLDQALADLDLVDRLDTIRLNKATIAAHRLDLSGTDQDYSRAFQEFGVAAEGEEPERVAERVHGSAVRDRLVLALDDWANLTGGARQAWLLEIARRADPHEGRNRLRDPQAWTDPEGTSRLVADGTVSVSDLTAPLLRRVAYTPSGVEGGGVRLLAEAQRLHPDDFWINLDVANALVNTRKPEQAVGYYRAALALRPGTATVHLGLGTLLGSIGQVDDAIAECRRAVELDPNYGLAHFGLGCALTGKGRLDDAAAELRRGNELNPKFAQGYRLLGAILVQKGDLDGASTELRRALELEPNDPESHRTLGTILAQKGQLVQAFTEFGKAVELESKRETKAPAP
jgi:serine/threonine-protein kinase